MSLKKKLVLAYSGGLDTSFCIKYLTEEKGFEVHTVLINTGGFSPDEVTNAEELAYKLGAFKHTTINIENEYYSKCIRFLVYGNILRNNTYPLSVSSERTFQAIAIINHAREIGACFISHGSTGAGNDQVRFDLAFNILAPEIEIITPIRDLQLSRQQEIDYLTAKGVNINWKQHDYSINKGIWGTSIGGKETLTSHSPIPDNAFPSQANTFSVSLLTLRFSKGELHEVNDIYFSNPLDAIKEVEKLASAYAIGRDIHTGDTIIGIKGRVAFEAAAPLVIIKAHHTLEKHVLTKWQQYWKEQLANWYGMFLHEAQYFEPVMRNIELFLEETQKNVTGKVYVRLFPYRFTIEGIESEFDLMDSKFAMYGEKNMKWSADDVKGFIKVLSTPLSIYHQVNNR